MSSAVIGRERRRSSRASRGGTGTPTATAHLPAPPVGFARARGEVFNFSCDG